MFERITQLRIVRVLIAGFTLVIILLLAAGYMALRNARFIQESAGSLVEQQFVTTRLVDEIQLEQGTLSAVFYYLENESNAAGRAEILERLREADAHIARILASVAQNPPDPLWDQFRSASQRFLADARRLLEEGDSSRRASSDLFHRHEEVVAIVAKLSQASNDQAVRREAEIQWRSRGLMDESFLFLGAGLVLALVCAVFTVRMTTTLFTNMEWQANELSRVSWHMVHDQETSARRFSHELHDELGQALTAIRTNLVALASGSRFDEAVPRISDCVRLADEAIRNVRELSQLLHPVILDDFGLDAGLRWLAEGFQTRTGIAVEYASTFSDRLPEDTETHLFRIAQEALTNIARHSGASRVRVALGNDGGMTRLSIGDNGHGFSETSEAPNNKDAAVGIVGMRARARSAGGELRVHSAVGQGVQIEVNIPAIAIRAASDRAY